MDQKTQESYIPLEENQGIKNSFHLVKSPLSQFGCLGFEHGYSLGNLIDLVMWEVQQSEYVNNAQQIIDQFITTSEKKWGR